MISWRRPNCVFHPQTQDSALNGAIWWIWWKLICAAFARWSAFYLSWVIGYKTSSSQKRPWDAVTVSISAILTAEEIQALTSSEGSADERLLISGSFGRGSHTEQLRMHTQSNCKFSIQFPSNGVPSKPYLCLNILMLGAWSNKGWRGFIHWGDRLNILIGQYKTHTKLESLDEKLLTPAQLKGVRIFPLL